MGLFSGGGEEIKLDEDTPPDDLFQSTFPTPQEDKKKAATIAAAAATTSVISETKGIVSASGISKSVMKTSEEVDISLFQHFPPCFPTSVLEKKSKYPLNFSSNNINCSIILV